jgi:hypothetical protein
MAAPIAITTCLQDSSDIRRHIRPLRVFICVLCVLYAFFFWRVVDAMEGGRKSGDGVVDATRKAMQILAELSDAAVSGGKLSSEMSSCANANNAKCQPWSKQDYLSRLASFSPMTWFNKPITVSGSECARHGWRNEGIDRLRCDSCKALLTISIHPSLNEPSTLAVATKFKEQLVKTGHSDMCPWRDQVFSTRSLNIASCSLYANHVYLPRLLFFFL